MDEENTTIGYPVKTITSKEELIDLFGHMDVKTYQPDMLDGLGILRTPTIPIDKTGLRKDERPKRETGFLDGLHGGQLFRFRVHSPSN